MASMAAMGGFGQGIGQAMPNLLKLSGMQQQQNQFQADMAMKNETLKIAQDKAKQERNIMGYQERELAEKEATGNKLFDVEDFLTSQGMPPEQVERSKKFVASTGLYETVNDRMKIKSRHIDSVMKMAKQTPQFSLEIDQMESIRLGKEINRLDEEMGKIKEQEPFTYPENKKYVTTHQNRAGLANKRSTLDSSINELKKIITPLKEDMSATDPEILSGLKGQQAKEELLVSKERLERAKNVKVSPSWHTVEDKNSLTGYSYQNLNDPTAPLKTNAPKPSSVREPTFKDKMIEKYWNQFDDQTKLKVMGAIPPDKELTEKNIVDVYGNIFTDAETKKALQPIVEEITKKAAAKNVPPGKKISILPKGSKQIGTLNGKPVYEDADGKRYIQE